jgi:hypothetical protein
MSSSKKPRMTSLERREWFRQVAKAIRLHFLCSVVDFSPRTVKLLQDIGTMDLEQLRELFGSGDRIINKTTTSKEAEAAYFIAGLRARAIEGSVTEITGE